MHKVGVVAWYTFLEGVRARFFVGTVFVALAVVLIGTIVGSIPYGRPDQIVAAIGWGAVFLSGALLSMFYVTTAVHFERDARVLHMLLSKPIRPGAYAVGKLLGFTALTWVMLLVEVLVLYAATWLVAERPDYRPDQFLWLAGFVSVGCKCTALLAFAAWFAWMLETQMLGMLASSTVFLAGVGTQDLIAWAKYAERPVLAEFGEVLSWLVPQFSAYDLMGWAIYGVRASWLQYAEIYVYFLGYAMISATFLWLTAQWQELK